MASAAALQFGQQLASTLLPTTVATGSQLVLSPLSVWFALLLVLTAAGPSSVTFNELWYVTSGNSSSTQPGANSTAALAALNSQVAALRAALGRQATAENKLTIADGIWTKDIAVNPAYAGDMQRLYNATVQPVSSAAPINAWAAASTNNLIPKVVEESDVQNMRMIITNAIYFKGTWLDWLPAAGTWQYTFDKVNTKPQPFKALLADSPTNKVTEVQVPMMQQTFAPTTRFAPGSATPRQQIAVSEAAGKYRAVRLPYKDSGGLAAVFVLPDESYASVADAAGDITGQMVLNETSWAPIKNTLKLSLPKFEVEGTLDLKSAIQSLGVTNAFTDTSNHRGLSDTPLLLTDIKQTVHVKVDEQGTMIGSGPTAVPEMTELVFDRPFLFLIVETTTQTVTVQGVIPDPRER